MARSRQMVRSSSSKNFKEDYLLFLSSMRARLIVRQHTCSFQYAGPNLYSRGHVVHAWAGVGADLLLKGQAVFMPQISNSKDMLQTSYYLPITTELKDCFLPLRMLTTEEATGQSWALAYVARLFSSSHAVAGRRPCVFSHQCCSPGRSQDAPGRS